jgi:hypothetical protein
MAHIPSTIVNPFAINPLLREGICLARATRWGRGGLYANYTVPIIFLDHGGFLATYHVGNVTRRCVGWIILEGA